MANKPERSREVNEEGLTEKEALFVLEYLVDLNQTQAYHRAYPDSSYNTAMANSSKIMKKPRVQSAIQREMDARAQRTLVTADSVIADIVSVKDRCMQAEPVLNRKGEHVTTSGPDGAESLAYTFDSSGALKALELLGKHLVLFTDKTKIEGDINVHSGVLRMPAAEAASVDDWERQASSQQSDLKKSVTGSTD